jgi:peptidoglycan hydrolase-like protein with peptidoglycan-binding domain
MQARPTGVIASSPVGRRLALMMSISTGSQGQSVKQWQRFMMRQGYFRHHADGTFCIRTQIATMAFQEDAGCFADGVVGAITESFAKQLGFDGFDHERAHLQKLADGAGIPPEVLEAVMISQHNGDSRTVIFRPEMFIRAIPDARNRLRPGKDYQAFLSAYRIDKAEALRSTYFGAYEINGGFLLELYERHPSDAFNAFDEHPERVSEELVAAWFARNQRARKAANKTPPDCASLAFEWSGPHYSSGEVHSQIFRAWQKTKKAHP